MLRTHLCDLLGIELPIIQAGMTVHTSPALVAAVCNAGALGTLGAWQRPAEVLQRDLAAIRERTDRPFAVNHVVPALDEAGFAVTLEAGPAVISFALDDPGALVDRAHDAGCLVTHQVTTARQASSAADRGVDVIIAQGGEAGGFGGTVAGLVLIPAVVDAVSPVPVVAAGGIADGRGLAAALVLGAVGVSLGTRFLASAEAPISQGWKDAIVEAAAEEWIQVGFVNDLNPVPGVTGYGTRLRVRHTPFTDRWEQRREEIRRDRHPVVAEIVTATDNGTLHEHLVVAGQSAGLIADMPPVAEIVHRIVAEAVQALRDAGTH
jgi:nitronate monooxygenase/enoyl-[acyl-carrier protein] reductase II